jgi:hypothetical protein
MASMDDDVKKKEDGSVDSSGLNLQERTALPLVVICPAIGAAVASTKFPSQLSTHLTRLVVHLHSIPAN